MNTTPIKQEHQGSPEGLLPSEDVEVPTGFEREEWVVLTGGYVTEEKEVESILGQRGLGGSQQGRPTNTKAPFTGQLSNTKRAIAQRERAALLDGEGKAIEKARAADRSAKYQLHQRLKSKDERYLALTKDEDKERYLAAKSEEMAQKRHEQQKSAEWLQAQLKRVHKKWEDIRLEVDLRRHQGIMEKRPGKARAGKTANKKNHSTRALERVYGNGGALGKAMWSTYQDGLAKLKTDSFETKEAKEEWLQFVEGLTPEEVSLVSGKTWKGGVVVTEEDEKTDFEGFSDETDFEGFSD